jgi:hypothetical protein
VRHEGESEKFVRGERSIADICAIVGERRARSLGTALPRV